MESFYPQDNPDASPSLNQSGIYAIIHITSNKMYIGSSYNMAIRTSNHAGMLRRGVHPNIKLQRAWNKYDEAAFKMICVEAIEDNKQLLIREQWYLDNFKPAYNIASDATVGGTKEGRSKGGIASRGRHRPDLTERNKARKGEHHTQEHIDKSRAAQKGKPKPGVSAALKGKPRPHVSAARRGRPSPNKGNRYKQKNPNKNGPWNKGKGTKITFCIICGEQAYKSGRKYCTSHKQQKGWQHKTSSW